MENKRLLSIIISIFLVFAILGTVSIAYATSYSSNGSLRQSKVFTTEYEIKVKGSITSSKLTASTEYAGNAKQVYVSGTGIRTDLATPNLYANQFDYASLVGTKKTAAISFDVDSGKKFKSAVNTHYVETSFGEWVKTYEPKV